MKLRERNVKLRREIDLTGLINIVFLILIFFIVAGTLRPFSERNIELVKTQPDTAGVKAPARVVVRQDGSMVFGGAEMTRKAFAGALSRSTEPKDETPFVIVSDARLSAKQLLEIARVVRDAGYENISLLTEKQRRSP